jgi:hypothetical protein
MSHILIRFNKSRGQPGRGTLDHVWRVFVDGKEYLFKNVNINTISYSERTGEDWNIACDGLLEIDRENSIAIINGLE